MFPRIRTYVGRFFNRTASRNWQKRTLVVGPTQPVDGDSVACCKAVVSHLRKQGLEAYTLPTLVMYRQLAWIFASDDFHPASIERPDFTTKDLQAAYDALIAVWRPDEVVLVDGPRHQLGFDTRGVPVFTIDHHIADGRTADDDEAYIQPAASAGCLLIDRFQVYEPILAVSILTDTFWLRQNRPAEAARYLAKLVEHGLTDACLIEMQRALMVRKDPAIVAALHDADLRFVDDIAFAVLQTSDAEIHRGVMGELGYFCKSICVIRGDGYVSMRTQDQTIDLRPVAQKYGGGGHPTIAAGHLAEVNATVVENLYRDFIGLVR